MLANPTQLKLDITFHFIDWAKLSQFRKIINQSCTAIIYDTLLAGTPIVRLTYFPIPRVHLLPGNRTYQMTLRLSVRVSSEKHLPWPTILKYVIILWSDALSDALSAQLLLLDQHLF